MQGTIMVTMNEAPREVEGYWSDSVVSHRYVVKNMEVMFLVVLLCLSVRQQDFLQSNELICIKLLTEVCLVRANKQSIIFLGMIRITIRIQDPDYDPYQEFLKCVSGQ